MYSLVNKLENLYFYYFLSVVEIEIAFLHEAV